VPLALYASPNAKAGERRDRADVVELTDIFPTFAALAQVLAPASLPGRDLFAGPPAEPRYGYAEFGDMLAVRSANHLLMARLWMHGGTALDPEITTRLVNRPPQGSTFALHDIVKDPMQTTDLVTTDTEAARLLYTAMVERRTGPGAPPEGALSAEQIEALRTAGALNYW
jgi:arylsulfatase A-like enzyme